MRIKLGFFGIIFVLIAMSSCKEECSVNNTFKEYWDKAIFSVEKSYYGLERDSNIGRDSALIFLELITKIESNVKGGHWGFYYEDEQSFKDDIKNWNKWYKDNKCDLRMSTVDSLYNLEIIKNRRFNNKIFPDDWKKLFFLNTK